MSDIINHPKHYTANPFDAKKLECIDFTRHMGFCDGNAFKYVWRAGSKGDALEDLDKALFYLDECRTYKPAPSVEAPILMGTLGFDERDESTKFRYKALRFIATGLWETAEEYVKALRRYYFSSAVMAELAKRLNEVAFNFKLDDTVIRMDNVTRAALVTNCPDMFSKAGTDCERFAGRRTVVDRKLEEGVIRLDSGEGHLDINVFDIIRKVEGKHDSAE